MRRLRVLPAFSLPAICTVLLLSTLGSLSGCQLLELRAASDVIPDSGILPVQGIAKSSHIARNAAGMPLIEADNFHDLLFTLGYSHASDRLTQMLKLRLLAQGRLAELEGAELLNLDRLMRAINLPADAQTLYKNAPKNLQSFFAIYARGVNAYLYQMRNSLPPELAQANFKADYWKAEDSALLFALLGFSQSGNLTEEILAFTFAQHLDAEQLPWLLPIYPDEPLALNERDKLLALPPAALQSSALRASTLQLLDTLNQLAAVNSLQAPLASSWAVSPPQSANRRSLLALTTLQVQSNPLADTTPPPAPYSWVNLHSPQLQAAGLTVPGIPLVLSGFNGQLAYSISAAMADTQDVFIEQLRWNNGRLEYFANEQWQATQQRTETFFIRGQQPVREALYSTAHGPLLTAPPAQSSNGYGLALQRAYLADDPSLSVVWQLLRSSTVEQAAELLPKLRTLSANVLLADAQHIAWQVTGTYPNRRNSRGLFPSPGWDNSVAWEGYAEPLLHPYDQDPAQGWLSAANQRLMQPGYGMQLSSSWASPERAENLALQLRNAPVTARLASQDALQHRPWLVAQLQHMLTAAGMPEALQQVIAKLPNPDSSVAQQVLQQFLAINSQQPLSSAESAWLERFLLQGQEQLFKQQLQDLPSSMQTAFALHNQHSYPAWLDHLLGRAESPLWQTVAASKAHFLVDNLVSSHQARRTVTAAKQPTYSQLMQIDFSRRNPLAAATFSGQTDNPHSPYAKLTDTVVGQLYPLPLKQTEIDAVYSKQRLSLVPATLE